MKLKIFYVELESGLIQAFYAESYDEAADLSEFYVRKVLHYKGDYDVYQVIQTSTRED